MSKIFSLDRLYLKNISWQSSGNISAQVVNILSLPIITRLFTPEDIGLLRIFIEVLAVFTIFISFRVEQIILLPKNDEGAQELFGYVFGNGLISSFVLSLIICLFIIFGLIPQD